MVTLRVNCTSAVELSEALTPVDVSQIFEGPVMMWETVTGVFGSQPKKNLTVEEYFTRRCELNVKLKVRTTELDGWVGNENLAYGVRKTYRNGLAIS